VNMSCPRLDTLCRYFHLNAASVVSTALMLCCNVVPKAQSWIAIVTATYQNASNIDIAHPCQDGRLGKHPNMRMVLQTTYMSACDCISQRIPESSMLCWGQMSLEARGLRDDFRFTHVHA